MLFALRNYGYSFRHVCGIMGHIFSDMYGIIGPNFLTKMARPRSPSTPWAVGCRVVSRCIVLEVRSAVADESANELYNCNDLFSLIFISSLLVWQLFFINSDDFAKVHLIFRRF